MLPPRASTVAVATCAAASLGRSSRADSEPASVQAAAQLARHAALDAGAALSARRSARRAHQLLGRGGRRLAYSYALTARLLLDHVPASAPAAAIFNRGASEFAGYSAALAQAAGGRLQALAVRLLHRAAWLQEDVAFELSTARSAGSIEDLIEALSAALQAHDALLAALDATALADRLSRRHRRALEASRARGSASREALRVALTSARRAVQDPAREDRADLS